MPFFFFVSSSLSLVLTCSAKGDGTFDALETETVTAPVGTGCGGASFEEEFILAFFLFLLWLDHTFFVSFFSLPSLSSRERMEGAAARGGGCCGGDNAAASSSLTSGAADGDEGGGDGRGEAAAAAAASALTAIVTDDANASIASPPSSSPAAPSLSETPPDSTSEVRSAIRGRVEPREAPVRWRTRGPVLLELQSCFFFLSLFRSLFFVRR